ncbi:DUF1707 domain-containing protein [Tessaracoccus massiliensis]|uniref:DUF1707 domain-containing protein n=1 Tax=Tessaracoccus massiliensis TaxID=1522311 RepID=UPI000693EBD5|nr:DUF1707 domain-containing protein [Tessaracoccus massiliensis]
MAADYMRIGDAERDEAVGMLREHHATGRLGSDEFDDRMSRALQARTRSELDALFLDLPDPRPGSQYTGAPAYPQPVVPPAYGYDQLPDSYGQPPPPVAAGDLPRPWYAQWWMLIVAILLGSALDISFPFIVFAALWIWVIYPSMVEHRRHKAPRAATTAPPRPLTYSEREWVMEEVRAGRKINAIKRYRELTGADLVTAKNTVESWGRQIGR